MALTREYQETVMARIKRDRKFARALYAEITFKELARQTGLGEKTLHRMLNRRGNPTAHNLGLIVKSIAEDLGIKPRVQVIAG